MAVRVTSVYVEHLTHMHGLWCRRCQRSSAVRAWMVMRLGDRASLLTRDQCLDCGSHDVEPPAPVG